MLGHLHASVFLHNKDCNSHGSQRTPITKQTPKLDQTLRILSACLPSPNLLGPGTVASSPHAKNGETEFLG